LRLAVAEKIRHVRRKSLVGQAVVTLIGLQLLFLSTFVCLPVPIATGNNISNYLHNQAIFVVAELPAVIRVQLFERYPDLTQPERDVRFSLYVPQCPAAVFTGYILGWQLGLIASSLYLILGLAGSWAGLYLFAAGGGPGYYAQSGFGYLVGMVVASWVAGRLTSGPRTSVRQALAIVAGVASVHALGLTYLMLTYAAQGMLATAKSQPDWHAWIFEQARNLSWYALPYDALFSTLLVALGFPSRWLVLTLVAPDIAVKAKVQPRLEDIG
jgi:biotin transporter BioY